MVSFCSEITCQIEKHRNERSYTWVGDINEIINVLPKNDKLQPPNPLSAFTASSASCNPYSSYWISASPCFGCICGEASFGARTVRNNKVMLKSILTSYMGTTDLYNNMQYTYQWWVPVYLTVILVVTLTKKLVLVGIAVASQKPVES